jgi:UDP-glucose 6-dehydrogenase
MVKAKKSSKSTGKKPLIGFIGQGWIGKNYADDFERRGYTVVRYALEEPYLQNKDRIAEADIVFVAVPTPTTPKGFDDSIVRASLSSVGKGKTAVIKSTLKPGTLESLQKQYPDIFLMHAPEFLSRGTAAYDAAHPIQNIIGIPVDDHEYRIRAKRVLAILPKASPIIVSARTAELFKYVHNTSLFARGIYMNILYDIARNIGVDWADIKEMIIRDPMLAFQDPVVAKWHIDPVRDSGTRGIGGDCHIKDFETLERLYKETVSDTRGLKMIRTMKEKNLELLLEYKKDLDLVRGVYGKEILKRAGKRPSTKKHKIVRK